MSIIIKFLRERGVLAIFLRFSLIFMNMQIR